LNPDRFLTDNSHYLLRERRTAPGGAAETHLHRSHCSLACATILFGLPSKVNVLHRLNRQNCLSWNAKSHSSTYSTSGKTPTIEKDGHTGLSFGSLGILWHFSRKSPTNGKRQKGGHSNRSRGRRD
jgi:hypothetical protein